MKEIRLKPVIYSMSQESFPRFFYHSLLCFTFTFIISAPRGKMLIFFSVKLSYVTDQEKSNRILDGLLIV